jgi:hypothetical protein
MKTSATAFFHQGWNTWVVGIYDRPGTASSYIPMNSEKEAKDYADQFNRTGRR